MTTKPNVVDRPPPNTLRVNAWRDMPEDRTPARYEVQSGGADPKAIIVSKGPRVVLDALIKQPVFCASPVRISECVSVLRHDFGVPIDMTVYENDRATGRRRFGVYTLAADVRRIEGQHHEG